MADIVDISEVFKAILDDAAIAKIRYKAKKFDPGIAGECDQCGEEMPRLVNGICCRCRDKLKLP